jgi:membrane-associated phospholipid phosphatase
MRVRLSKSFIILVLILGPVQLFSQNIDIQLLRAINSSETLPSDRFFRFVSNSDIYFSLAIPVTEAGFGLVKHDKALLRNVCVTAASLAVNGGITVVLKYSINRARPFVTYPDITKKARAGSPSFPSGHTSLAFASATSLSLVYPKWYVIIPAYTWACTVGYSRMVLGVHYPSDVLGGAIVGAGSAWLTYVVNKKLNFDSNKHK